MLNPDFRDMLSSLNEAEVEFLVVGAYALSAHGLNRATGDIDIFLRNSPQNAQKVMQALKNFGAPLMNISEEDFTSDDIVVQLGVEPSRIDLITRISGLSYEQAWDNKVPVTVSDLDFFVLAKSDLLINKTAADRDKDKGDIAWLKKNL